MDHSGLETAGLDGMQDDDSHINISDVIEAIETTDPDFSTRSNTMIPGGTGGLVSASEMSLNTKRNAYVKIVEQPASKAMRFRYECEGRSAGSIPGASSTPENKTYPAIQVIGYKGRAVVVVSCVTKDQPYRSHPHNLVGKDGCKKGVCTVEVSTETMSVTFSNLGIRCVKKKDIEEALRIREEIRVDPFRQGFSHRNQPSSIDLNAVRLCFQVFLEGDSKGKFTLPLTPVVSEPIYDKKAMSDLVICKLSECTSSVAGGKEIILLCEKVAKEDIQIRFYEEHDGQIVWEALGDFQPSHVHKQVAISFRTPRYHTLEVNNPVRVNIQLLRPSDKACSEPWSFELLPLDSDPDVLKRKRQKFGNDPHSHILQHLQNQEASSNLQQPFNTVHIPGTSIKAEPREPSPQPYIKMFGGGLSPSYSPGATLSPKNITQYRIPPNISPGTTPSPIDITQHDSSYPLIHFTNAFNIPQNSVNINTMAGSSMIEGTNQIIDFSQQHQRLSHLATISPDNWNINPNNSYPLANMFDNQQMNNLNMDTYNNMPGTSVVNNNMNILDNTPVGLSSVLDLDSQELKQLGSAELTGLFGPDLSENLSISLSLSENKIDIRTNDLDVQQNMTDSLTNLAKTTTNEICNLNNLYKTK